MSNSLIVTLDDVRAHLAMPDTFTAHDDMLQRIFIPAAADALRIETDYTVPTQFDEYYDGGGYSIWLRNHPVLSVALVEEGWGFTNFALEYVQVNTLPSAGTNPMFAYSRDDDDSGRITRRFGGNVPGRFVAGESNIHVVYTAGRQNCPPAIYFAALELIAHFYQNSMQRAGSGGNAAGYDAVNVDFPHSGADITTTINQGIPFRILELVKAWRRDPIVG